MQRRFARQVPVRTSRPVRFMQREIEGYIPSTTAESSCLNNANVVEEDVCLARPSSRQVWGNSVEIRVTDRGSAGISLTARVLSASRAIIRRGIDLDPFCIFAVPVPGTISVCGVSEFLTMYESRVATENQVTLRDRFSWLRNDWPVWDQTRLLDNLISPII